MILTQLAPPAALPVDAPTARAHLRIDHDTEDGLIETYIGAAVAELDGPAGVLGRCIMPQGWRVQLADWSGPIALPVEPVLSLSVSYRDAAGDLQVLGGASWYLTAALRAAPVLTWRGPLPVLGDVPWPVEVTVEAGLDPVPEDIRVAILLRVADLYQNREAQIAGTSHAGNPAYDALVAKNRRFL